MLDKTAVHGAWFAVVAYTFWGVAPIYFKWVGHVSPFELVAQRVIWSVVLLLGILAWLGEFRALKLPREHWWKIGLTSLLLTFNWFVFIYAIVNNNIVETSLGYFINPLVSVFLGMIFLGERLRRLQWVAIGIAAAGIGYQLLWYGEIPWLALALAFSFGFYGLTRKNLGLHSVGGLALETMLMAPAALLWVGWNWHQGTLSFGHIDIRTDLLLVLSGFVTSFPLLCFAAAVRRLTLIAAGMFQYIAPSLSLMVATIAYGEPFGVERAITFAFIWVALAIFSAEAFHFHRRLGQGISV